MKKKVAVKTISKTEEPIVKFHFSEKLKQPQKPCCEYPDKYEVFDSIYSAMEDWYKIKRSEWTIYSCRSCRCFTFEHK